MLHTVSSLVLDDIMSPVILCCSGRGAWHFSPYRQKDAAERSVRNSSGIFVKFPETQHQQCNTASQRRPCIDVRDIKNAVQNSDFRRKKQDQIGPDKHKQHMEHADPRPGFGIIALIVSFAHSFSEKMKL
jgi:hypothetical protein